MIDIDTEFSSPNEATVQVSGEIDMNTSEQLREVLNEAADKDFESVVVDMEDVTFIDSSGIATLVESLQTLNDNDADLILTNLQDKVRSVFEISNLMEVFTIQ